MPLIENPPENPRQINQTPWRRAPIRFNKDGLRRSEFFLIPTFSWDTFHSASIGEYIGTDEYTHNQTSSITFNLRLFRWLLSLTFIWRRVVTYKYLPFIYVVRPFPPKQPDDIGKESTEISELIRRLDLANLPYRIMYTAYPLEEATIVLTSMNHREEIVGLDNITRLIEIGNLHNYLKS